MGSTEQPVLQPLDRVSGFAWLILCQLAGEVLVRVAQMVVPGLHFPGAVAGMLILLVLLGFMKGQTLAVMGAGNALLGVLTLLFVPSAVGIIQHGPLLQTWGLALIVAVVVSTVLTLLVTVGAFLATQKLQETWQK